MLIVLIILLILLLGGAGILGFIIKSILAAGILAVLAVAVLIWLLVGRTRA